MKTEQVRIPEDVAADGRIVAAAMGMTLPEYVTATMREAIDRDMPKAAKIVTDRAKDKKRKPTDE